MYIMQFDNFIKNLKLVRLYIIYPLGIAWIIKFFAPYLN